MTGADACANRLQSWLGSATRPTTAAPMPLVSAVVTSGSAPPRRRAIAVDAAQHVAAQRQPAAEHRGAKIACRLDVARAQQGDHAEPDQRARDFGPPDAEVVSAAQALLDGLDRLLTIDDRASLSSAGSFSPPRSPEETEANEDK